MSEIVPPLTLRIEKGLPLSAAEGDQNLKILRDAINALFARFGVALNPDGTVKGGAVGTLSLLDRSVTGAKLAFDSAFFGADAGLADAFKITFTPPLADYAQGMVFWVLAANANTGPATLQVDDAAPIPIKKRGSAGVVDLVANDILPGQVFAVLFDGINFQLLSAARPSAAWSQYSIAAAASAVNTVLSWSVANANFWSIAKWTIQYIPADPLNDQDQGYRVGDELDVEAAIQSDGKPAFAPFRDNASNFLCACITAGGVSVPNKSTFAYGALADLPHWVIKLNVLTPIPAP